MALTSETITPCCLAGSTTVTDKGAAPPRQSYVSANLHDITSEKKAVFIL
jgi:hypothetical protein